MKQSKKLTAIIELEGDGYLALCPELDIASQGDSIEGAKKNSRKQLNFSSRMPTQVRFVGN